VVAILQPLKNHEPIPIDRAVILVGRGRECDVVINGSRKISRKHCCLVQSDQTFFIRDLGSTNGVWVNGQRVDRESEMSAGDRVAIGDVQFQFYPNGLKRSGIQVLDDSPIPNSNASSPTAGSGIVILESDDSSEHDELVDVIEINDDNLLDDDLIDDDDLVEVEGIDEILSEPSPPKPKGKGKPFRREIESEPVINLDDSFADEAVEDIINFDE